MALLRLVAVVGLAVLATPIADAAPGYRWPLEPRPEVVTPFAPGAYDWLPGHRGVDLAGPPDAPIRAVGSGTVIFAGTVGGKPVVSIDHGNGLRTTYEPVIAAVGKGRLVASGEVIGFLQPDHPGCPAAACLHLGLRRGEVYLDPLGLFGGHRIVLRQN